MIASVAMRMIFVSFLQFLMMGVIARELGAEGQSEFAIIYATGILLSIVIDGGLSASKIYFGAKKWLNKNNIKFIERTGIYYTLLISLGVSLVSIYMPNINFKISINEIFLAFSVSRLALINSGFIVTKEFKVVNSLALIQSILSLLLIVIVSILNNLTPDIAVNIISFVNILCALVGWKKRGSQQTDKDGLSKKEILSYATRSAFSDGIANLNYRVSYFFLAGLGSQLGIYSLAVGFLERLWIPAQAAVTVLTPDIASGEVNKKINKKYLLLATLLISSFIFIFWLLSKLAAEIVFGASYADLDKAILSLSFGVVSWFVVKVLAAYMAAIGKPEANLKTALISLVVTVVSFLCVRVIGFDLNLYVAGVITSTSYFIGLVYLWKAAGKE